MPRPRARVTRGGGPDGDGTEEGSGPRPAAAPGCGGAGGAPSEGLLPRREGQDRTVGSLNHGQSPARGSSGCGSPRRGLRVRRGEAKPRGLHRPGYLLLRKKSFPPGQGRHGWGETGAHRNPSARPPALPVGAGLEDLLFYLRVPPPPPKITVRGRPRSSCVPGESEPLIL